MKVAEFVKQVISEVKKVTWSNKTETLASVYMVLGVVVICSLLFFLIDLVMYKFVNFVLNLGG